MDKSKSATKIQKVYKKYLYSKNVLEPCDPSSIKINIDIIKKKIKDDILTDGKLEFYEASSTKNYKLDDGHMEYITSKGIEDSRWVGPGNNPIDVLCNNQKLGIDVACVCCNGNETNEKSIIQNFKNSGNLLDIYFENNKPNNAIDLYKKDYIKKLTPYINHKLYYLIYISIKNKIYISLFKLNIFAIQNISCDGISKSNKSINCCKFIDNKYGSVKLYKSKKRLEIRFKREIINNFNTTELF